MGENDSITFKVKDYFIQKGYRVESGFKYGCDFILYKHDEITHKHGEALLLINQPNSCISLSHQLASFVRLASIVHKKAYFAYCHDNDIVIVEIKNKRRKK